MTTLAPIPAVLPPPPEPRSSTVRYELPLISRVVPVDRGGRVDPVHDEIERAAVVQIDIRGAVREPRLRQPPGGGHVRERQVPLVAKRVVGQRGLGHLFQQRQILTGYSLGHRG